MPSATATKNKAGKPRLPTVLETFLTTEGFAEGNPWPRADFLHQVVNYRAADVLALPEPPSGPVAKRLRESVGVSLERLRSVLWLPLPVLTSFEEGERTLVADILDIEYGGLAGACRLYGTMAAWVEERGGSPVVSE